MNEIEKGQIYIFTKSGNKVRAIAKCGGRKDAPLWLVERTGGECDQKRMIVPSAALAEVQEL